MMSRAFDQSARCTARRVAYLRRIGDVVLPREVRDACVGLVGAPSVDGAGCRVAALMAKSTVLTPAP
jgi:hypothetical protein